MRKKDFMNTKSPFIMITKHQNSYLMEQMVWNLKLAWTYDEKTTTLQMAPSWKCISNLGNVYRYLGNP